MQNHHEFVQYTTEAGAVIGLNLAAVGGWEYYPAKPETDTEEGRPSLLTINHNPNHYRGAAADYFFECLSISEANAKFQNLMIRIDGATEGVAIGGIDNILIETAE